MIRRSSKSLRRADPFAPKMRSTLRRLRVSAPSKLRLAPFAIALCTHAAWARPHVRRHFEPTDLQFETPGTSELDVEFGSVRGQDAWRIVAPDFELDLGLTRWLEIDVDGAYAVEGAPKKEFTFDHAATDPLWPSFKLGLVDWVDQRMKRTYGLGLQLGPKLPTFAGGVGVGVEGLLLGGLSLGGTRLALNMGGFADPAPDAQSPRPVGIENGIDWEQDLDKDGSYAIGGELSSVVFISDDPAQLQASFGGTYAATEWLDLSATALLGFIPGSDRFGLMLGFAPHLPLWTPAPKDDESASRTR